MKAKDNGSAESCIKNLLSLAKAENPFAREKGLGTDYIDTAVGGEEQLADNIEELIESYEPRLTGSTIVIDHAGDGNFGVQIDVRSAYEEGEEE